jgi:GH25 family lysozyme M1 (1,4-beta-N-acetylmuramidase)
VSTCRGIDLSSYQGPQNWTQHRHDGVVFAFIKASEGEHSRDQRFSAHMRDAKTAGMVVGAYHFAWPNQSAAHNAANYVDAVRSHAGPGFIHWLDLEPYPDRRNFVGRSSGQIRAWASVWLDVVQRAFPGQRVGIYAGNDQAVNVPGGHPRWLPSYPYGMGVSAYSLAEKHVRIAGNVGDGGPARGVEFWQFCGGPLDRSLYYGTEADLRKWAGGAASPAKPKPKPKPKPPAARARVWVVRSGQTLGAIALALGASLASVVSYNHIANPNRIYPGERITAPPVVPPAMKPQPPAVQRPRAAAGTAVTTHKVKPDETLSGIAAAAGVKDWHTLATFNHLTHPDRIFPGQTIRIPGKK